MQKQEGAPWGDERWLEEQLKREAAIFEEPAAPEPMSQRPSLEGQPLEGRPPAPLEQPVPAPAPAVPGRAGNGGKRFSRKELRNGIRMAVLLGTPKALQKEGDEFECWKR